MDDATTDAQSEAPAERRSLLSVLPGGPAATVVFVVVGVVALALGGWLAFVTFASDDEAAAERTEVPTRTVQPRKGGFTLEAPTSMKVKRGASTLSLTTSAKDLAITVGPSGPGAVKASDRRILSSLRQQYRKVRVISSEQIEVNGRTALTTGGQAVNSKRVKLRFVIVTVPGKRINHSITAFTTFDSDPATVLPLVNRVVEGFSPAPRKK